MDNITDERFRGSIGDLRAFQKPGLETFNRPVLTHWARLVPALRA